MDQKYSIAKMMGLSRENWPEVASEETEIVLSVIRLNDILLEKSREILERLDLSQAAFETLTTLRCFPDDAELSPTELYKSILISSGGMTKVLKHLEGKSWIERLDNPQDKRSKLVRLTSSGRRIAERSMAEIEKGDHQVLTSNLKGKEITDLCVALRTALEKIEKE